MVMMIEEGGIRELKTSSTGTIVNHNLCCDDDDDFQNKGFS